jgi:hypothetical protein
LRGDGDILGREELTSGCDLLPRGCDTNDDTLAPAFVAGLERGTHDVDVARAIESVVAATIRHIDQATLDSLTILQFLRVNKIGRTELGGPLSLPIIDINDNDLPSTLLYRALDYTETNTPSAENSDIAPLLNTVLASRDHSSAITGCDTTTEQARTVHGCLVRDSNDGNVGHNRVLRKSRAAHEVEEILSFAPQTRGAVGHHAFALRGADFAAEVGLAGFAEFAFFTFWGTVQEE